jgi:hypothetical protein
MNLAMVSDDALPGLHFVADSKAFLPALSRALTDAGRSDGPLQSMRIIRIRHRRGERAIVQVEFVFQAPENKTLSAAIWLYAGGKAARRAHKAAAGNAAAAPVYEPSSGALVHFFPSDPFVPDMARFVSNPRSYSGQLLSGLAAPAGEPELARFRPGIGATFRWRDAGKRVVYVKILKDCDAGAAASLLEAMGDASLGKSFSVPKPLGFCADVNGLAMEEALGETLDQRLARSTPRGAHMATAQVLHALRDFHTCAVVPRLRKGRSYFISRAQVAAQLIDSMEPSAGSHAKLLADRISHCDVSLAEEPAHCDIKLEHILLSRQKVTLLDLDSLAISDPLYDLAMLDLRASMAARSGMIGEAAYLAVRDSVRQAALLHYNSDAAARLSWLKACASMQLARHYAQNVGPNSGEHCLFALKMGERCLVAHIPSTTMANPPRIAKPDLLPIPTSEETSCV